MTSALQEAARALRENRIAAAAQILRGHLAGAPGDAGALHMLAEVQMRGGRPDRAEASLRRALAAAPDFAPARHSLGRLLMGLGRLEEALAEARRLPEDAAGLHLLASVLSLLGEQEAAAATYQRLLDADAADAQAWLGYGHMLRMLGRADEAVEAFRKAVALRPDFGEAYWSLADLKTFRFSDDDVARMRAQLARSELAAGDRSYLLYALGKAEEDAGRPAEAFARYSEGAALRASKHDDPARVGPFAARAIALMTPDFFAARAGAGCAAPDPIFIVGLPRSGSTLVEQILASHSQVEATMELPDLQMIARSLVDPERAAAGATYLDVVADLDAAALSALGARYLETTRVRRKQGRPLFIDKMPSNWAHVGLIQLILPNARIVDVRRHPMACGWSCFKQHFPPGQAFTYDLAQFGRYYREYVRLMAHYDAALPGRVHRVTHEQLAADPEPQIRALLDYCGLPFEEACLRPHETRRAVRSASSEQVRRPISAAGLDDWRAFEPWLGPLREALGDAVGQ